MELYYFTAFAKKTSWIGRLPQSSVLSSRARAVARHATVGDTPPHCVLLESSTGAQPRALVFGEKHLRVRRDRQPWDHDPNPD